MDFGKNLKKLRIEKELTQEQLGEALGISSSAVSSYENNKVIPNEIIRERISKYFGIESSISDIEDVPSSNSTNDMLDELMGNFASIHVICDLINIQLNIIKDKLEQSIKIFEKLNNELK